MDTFGLTAPLGRAPVNTRQEVVVRPYKAVLEPKERRLLRDMLDKITPQDSVITIDTRGLAVAAPIPVRASASDSTYYQVEKIITGTPVLESYPHRSFWRSTSIRPKSGCFHGLRRLAPYCQYNIIQEYGYYYLIGGGPRSPIDAVTYSIMSADGTIRPENPFEMFETTGQYTDWIEYEKADSPDNYPGGKFGITPMAEPALNTDRSPYQFPYPNQQAYVDEKKVDVLSVGGLADDLRYKLPIEKPGQTKRTYTADLAIAYSAPSKDSTVTSSLHLPTAAAICADQWRKPVGLREGLTCLDETKFYFDYHFPLKIVRFILDQLFGKGKPPIDTGVREWFSQPRPSNDVGTEVISTLFKLPLSDIRSHHRYPASAVCAGGLVFGPQQQLETGFGHAANCVAGSCLWI